MLSAPHDVNIVVWGNTHEPRPAADTAEAEHESAAINRGYRGAHAPRRHAGSVDCFEASSTGTRHDPRGPTTTQGSKIDREGCSSKHSTCWDDRVATRNPTGERPRADSWLDERVEMLAKSCLVGERCVDSATRSRDRTGTTSAAR
jgi:hypothetical protein